MLTSQVFSTDSVSLWRHRACHGTLFWICEEQEAAEHDLLVVGVPHVGVSLLVLEGLQPNPLPSSELYDRAARQNLEHNAGLQTRSEHHDVLQTTPGPRSASELSAGGVQLHTVLIFPLSYRFKLELDVFNIIVSSE